MEGNLWKKIVFFFSLFSIFPLLSKVASAHCPLCTVGAAAAAGGALWLGVSPVIVALFIGAFAVSMGWWFGRILKKQYVPYQKMLIIIASFLLTVIPVLPIMSMVHPLYISLIGDYGTLLHRIYMIDLALVGSLIGGFIVCISPWLSKKFSGVRDGKIIPFQGVVITLVLLMIMGVIIQLVL